MKLRVRQAAKILNCHENTVRNLVEAGKLKAFRDFNNHRVFKEADVLKVKNEREQLGNWND